ncbi:hypothetical protein MMC22_000252 [Lobaria immixta]|nr:hypothetical protein [Lobaria immixta]
MVEDPVEEIIRHFFKVPEIRQRLNLKSSVKFENYPNTLIDNTELRAHLKKLQITQPNLISQLKDADQKCIQKTVEGESISSLIVEYKAPHRLALVHIREGLRPMNPWNDFINNLKIPSDESSEVKTYHSSLPVAAVVTPTFFYMINAGLEYGYIWIGKASIFCTFNPTVQRRCITTSVVLMMTLVKAQNGKPTPKNRIYCI